MGSQRGMGADVDEPGLPLTFQVCPCPREEEEVDEKEEEEAVARGLHGTSSEALSVQ